jgi:hypothetical protein
VLVSTVTPALSIFTVAGGGDDDSSLRPLLQAVNEATATTRKSRTFIVVDLQKNG